MRGDHLETKSDLRSPFSKALLTLGEAILDAFGALFGVRLSPEYTEEKLRLFARIESDGPTGLWVSPWLRPVEIHLVLRRDSELNPPGQGGHHHVFGIAHELAHLVMLFDDPDFGQGFADFVGAAAVDHAARLLGRRTWPRPYDCAAEDGTAYVKRIAASDEPGTEGAAIYALCTVADRHGTRVIGQAINRLASCGSCIELENGLGEPLGLHSVAEFVREIARLTGDRSLSYTFRKQGFGARHRPQSVSAAELWGCCDQQERNRLLRERWGGRTRGKIDGVASIGLLIGYCPEVDGGAVRFGDLTIRLIGGAWTSAYGQRATGRIYVVGRACISPSDIVVEDDVVDADGRCLHLNPAGNREAIRDPCGEGSADAAGAS